MKGLYRLLVVLTAVLAGSVWYGCSTDFDVNAEWRDVTVIYGLLDQADSVHYIKVTKAFLGAGDAYHMAAVKDSSHYENVKVEYEVFHNKKQEHFAIANNVTQIMRDIIAFQQNHIDPLIEDIDKKLAEQSQEIRRRGGTSNLGVDSRTYFSKVFNVS